jgi:hypothetical protein
MKNRIGTAVRDLYHMILDLISNLYKRWYWRKVNNVATMAAMTASTLITNLGDYPPGSPEAVTTTEAVAALSRAGLILHEGQWGSIETTPDGRTVEQRAAVTGFADTATKDWLDNVLYEAGCYNGGCTYDLMVFKLLDPAKRWHRATGQPVVRVNGVPTVYMGDQLDADQIRREYLVRRSVQMELQRMWQITIYDREWGPSNLFNVLLQAAPRPRRSASLGTSVETYGGGS